MVDRSASRRPLASAVEAACAAGVDWIQLRDRQLETRAWLAWAETLAAAARRGRPDVRIIVNRRIDVALAIRADGVHLGFDAAPPDCARALLGVNALVGVSAHAPHEVAEAAALGASYAQLAPIFAPLSKPAERPELGAAALRASASHGVPVLAQGGIEADRCSAVIAAGAAGVAVTGAILLEEDPAGAARALRRALDAVTRV